MTDYTKPRLEMVERLAERYSGADSRILSAMQTVPRHRFVERGLWHRAYSDCSLPIGKGQTLSQPSTVLLCLSALRIPDGGNLLEIGSGSGYLLAVASSVCGRAYGMERHLSLVHFSRNVLQKLSIHNVQVRFGDGGMGWAPQAPYDAVLYSAALPGLPKQTVELLVEGGRIAAPVGGRDEQSFGTWLRRKDRLEPEEGGFACSFVPLVGSVGWDG
jgi:protein-L-isoaspartate(D-aspartate) O-methyltransferase